MKHHYINFESIASTHKYAIEKAISLDDGTVITADFQTEGIGRFDRKWISEKGDSLLVSIVIKRPMDPDDAKLMTPLLSLAVTKLLADYKINALIKWPNDVIVDGKKIAGILSTSSIEGDMTSFVIASVGININQRQEALEKIDIPATSIFHETCVQTRPQSLLQPLLSYFDDLYESFLGEGFSSIFKEWRSKQILIGKKICLVVGNEEVEGCVTSFKNDGAIEIETKDGSKKYFQAGEVIKIY